MNTEVLFETGQAAEASYADFRAVNDQQDLKDALIANEFTTIQATEFVRHWKVIHHQPDDSISGFSATLFESLDKQGEFTLAIRGTAGLVDLNADVGDIVQDGLAVKQIVDLYNYWQRLNTPVTQPVRLASLVNAPAGIPESQVIDVVEGGGPRRYTIAFEQTGETGLGEIPVGSGSINVAGHSLGGHLAMAFTRLFPEVNPTAYTINGAGFGVGDNNGNDLFNLLAERPTTFDDQSTVNIFGSAGFNFVSQDSERWFGLEQYGIRDELFTESADWDTTFGHASSQMTDSLAVYNLFIQLSSTLASATPGDALTALRPLFVSASNLVETSLEATVGALYDLFVTPGARVSIATDDREALYTHIQAIQDSPLFQQAAGLVEVVSVDSVVASAHADTGDGLAYRYALEQLNPFAITGDAGIYAAHNSGGQLNADQFTDQYLADRTAMLNLKDRLFSADATVQQRAGDSKRYEDLATGLVLSTNSSRGGADRHIQFGGGGDDVLTGGSREDQLYGADGADILTGDVGNDYLEGGKGNDTYVIHAGGDIDLIHDSDGLGRIEVNAGGVVSSLGGTIDSLPDATNLYEDADGNRYVLTGNDLHITLAATGEVVIKEFTDGMLGITLNAIGPIETPVIPGGTPVWQQGPGPTDQEQIAPSVFDPQKTLTPEIILAQVRGLAGPVFDFNAPGQIAGSVWGGLGDSEIQGDDGFNYIVDDVQTTAPFVNGNPGAFDWLLNDPVWDARLRSQLAFFWLGDRAGNDVLRGGGGNDWLISHGGDDWLYGEGGDDFLYDLPALHFGDGRWLALPGASSDDHLFGGAGQDLLITEQGDDYLDGGDGDDVLLSGQGDDDLTGGLGDDWLLADTTINRQEFVQQPDGSYARIIEAAEEAVDYGKDTLFGDEGSDTLAGGGEADWLQGGADDDTLWGDGNAVIAENGAIQITVGDGAIAGDDHLFGEQGNDTLIGGSGSDYLDGGEGDDVLQGDHVDLAPTYHGNDALYGGDGNDLLLGHGGNDDLSGEEGDDQLQGDEGDDNLFGGDGLDLLSGGAGHDLLSGDAGDDQLFGDDGDDGLFGGSGADLLEGGDGNDVLVGEAGADELFGAVGDDILEGGSGNDLLFGWEGDDVYFINTGDGEDVIIDSAGLNAIAFGEGIDQSSVTLTQFQANDGAYYLSIGYGNAGDHVLVKNGPLGTIRTIGFADGTTLNFADLMAQQGLPVTGRGTVGTDVIVGGAGIDQLDGQEGNDELHGGDGADRLQGGGGSDVLEGDAGDDVLDGGTGNDILRGGAGMDVYRIAWGMGQDTIEESGAEASVLQLDPGITPSDLVIQYDQNDLLVHLKGVDEGVRIKDYVLTAQPWQVQTDDGVSTPVDGLINGTGTEGFTDVTSAIDRYETGMRALFYTTLGAQGRVPGVDGKLHGSRASVTPSGATTQLFTDEFSIVEQVADDSLMGRISVPFVNTATRTQELISVASLDAVVGQVSLGSSGGTFQQSNDVGTFLPAGATIVNVFGRPQDLDGNTDAGVGGYNQTRGFWVFGSGAGSTPPANLQYQQVTHNIDRIDTQVTLERIIAGPADNDIVTRAHSVIDAGAGNDTVSASMPFPDRWDWRYSDSFEVNHYRYDRPYDSRNLGALLYGNAGDDRLQGSEAGDMLIGGDGYDYADGRNGEDTYLALAGDAGMDIIMDSGSLAADPEVFTTRYQDWYYQSLGLHDNFGGYDGGNFPPLPQVELNDYATIATLVSEGVIESDTVEFGQGIALSDLTFSWGEYVPRASSGNFDPDLPFFAGEPWFDSGSVHTTLDITWAAGRGMRVVIPHSSPMNNGLEEEVLEYAPFLDTSRFDWLLGTGLEQFRFADGTAHSMQEILALAPPAPTFDPHEQDNQIDGTDDSETLIGWSGDDVIRGHGGNDVYLFKSGDGVDTIVDTMMPGEGNIIAFGPGIFTNDLNVMRTGSDITIEVGTGGDAIVLNNSDPANGDGANVIEYLYFAHEDEVLLADLLPPGVPGEQITGTSRYDTLAGGAGDDTIDGQAGNDTIDGNEGNDTITGGVGRDTLNGGVGDDTFIVEGTDSRYDVFNGGVGLDTILGGNGDDTIRLRTFDASHSVEVIDGGAGANVIAGTSGYDTIDLNTTTVINIDRIDAGAGNDTVTGTDYADVIIGGAGRDSLFGAAGDDTFVIEGTDRRFDTFNGGAGVDTILGGDGDDTIRLRTFDASHSVEVIDGGAGTNVIAGTSGYDTIDLSVTALLNIDYLDAGPGNDTVTGTDQADLIIGGTGRDTLNGGAGDDAFVVEGTDNRYDTFNGGAGMDAVLGGVGDDTIRLRSFDAINGVEVIDGGTGVNVIAGTSGYDTIDLSATTAINIDHIDGGAGNDAITGTSSDDTIIGNTGRDVLNGGAGDDSYHFARGDGRDRLVDFEATANTDTLDFMAGIDHDQLWFSQAGQGLRVKVIGTSDEVLIQDWYLSPGNQIEQFHSGDGFVLLNTQVEQLVQAMSAFQPPASGELELPPAYQADLFPVLGVNWQAA